MYPLSGTIEFEEFGFITLPNGREVRLHHDGHYECDTNATVTNWDRTDFVWTDTGDELTHDEMHEPIEHEGTVYYTWEYVMEFAKPA